jgi:2-oxoglutarate dehydrogenase E2 component (dihydrolipoamide succinyltransferase)
MSDLSQRARAGKLQPSEVQDGTITLTNFGISGVMIGIPIIRFPEVAIVGMGAIYKRVVELDDGSFVSRSMMNISLTFDHRVIDGMYGCGFLNALKGHLEQKVN